MIFSGLFGLSNGQIPTPLRGHREEAKKAVGKGGEMEREGHGGLESRGNMVQHQFRHFMHLVSRNQRDIATLGQEVM